MFVDQGFLAHQVQIWNDYIPPCNQDFNIHYIVNAILGWVLHHEEICEDVISNAIYYFLRHQFGLIQGA